MTDRYDKNIIVFVISCIEGTVLDITNCCEIGKESLWDIDAMNSSSLLSVSVLHYGNLSKN